MTVLWFLDECVDASRLAVLTHHFGRPRPDCPARDEPRKAYDFTARRPNRHKSRYCSMRLALCRFSIVRRIAGRIALSHHWRGRRCGLFQYSFDEPIVRQVFVVLSYDGFRFPQCSKSPLNLQVFVSSDAFYNSAFFYEQLEFSWLIDVFRVACNFRNWGCEIDAPGGDPIPFDDTCECLSRRLMRGQRRNSRVVAENDDAISANE